jgi:large subunit ribosomal protein L24
MKIKKGDKVKILAGKDKGKEGQVETYFRKEEKVLVAGINLKKTTIKPKTKDEKGKIVELAFPIHQSNVQVVK